MIQELKLKLGGKERTFTFGIVFLGELLERLDLDYNSMLVKVSKNPFKYAPILMHESLINTEKRLGKEVDFTENDIVGWLEKEELMGVDIMLAFINAFMGTQDNKTPVASDEDEKDVKKK